MEKVEGRSRGDRGTPFKDWSLLYMEWKPLELLRPAVISFDS